MPDIPTDIESRKLLVQVLLQEYTSLRTEIIHRTNNLFQIFSTFIAVVVAVVGWSATKDANWSRTIRYGAFTVLYLAVFAAGLYFIIHGSILLAATRLKQIEQDVNALTGYEAMEWESKWGGTSRSGRLFLLTAQPSERPRLQRIPPAADAKPNSAPTGSATSEMP